jgi:hypothetical protein
MVTETGILAKPRDVPEGILQCKLYIRRTADRGIYQSSGTQGNNR